MEQALDRSKLEQKDRAELATIVEAMGGKATSRAKKADLVEQILTLAGVPAEGAAPNGDRPADTGPSLPEPEVVVPADTAGEDGPAAWELDAPAEDEQPPAPSGDRAPGQNGQGQQGGQGDDDGEPGNRRRRRRGHDRNRGSRRPARPGRRSG